MCRSGASCNLSSRTEHHGLVVLPPEASTTTVLSRLIPGKIIGNDSRSYTVWVRQRHIFIKTLCPLPVDTSLYFQSGGGVNPTLCILPGVWLVRSLSLFPLPVLLLPEASLRRHAGRHECFFLPSFLALSLTNEGHWNLQKTEHDNLYFGDMVSWRVWVSHLVGLQICAASPVPPLDKLAFFFPSRLSKCILHLTSGITDHPITQASYSGAAFVSD